MFRQEVVLPLSRVECYCGQITCFLAKCEADVISFICSGCNSTFYQIITREEEDKFIDYIRSQQI